VIPAGSSAQFLRARAREAPPSSRTTRKPGRPGAAKANAPAATLAGGAIAGPGPLQLVWRGVLPGAVEARSASPSAVAVRSHSPSSA